VHEPISHKDMDPNSRGEWEYFSRDELFMFRVLCWEQRQILNLDMCITRAYHEIPPAKQVHLAVKRSGMGPNSRGEWDYISRDEAFMFRVLCWEQHQILNLDMRITRAYHEIPPAKQVLLTGNVMIPDWMYVMLTRRYHSPKGELYIREWFSWSERLSACYDAHKEEECQLQKLDAEIQHAYHL